MYYTMNWTVEPRAVGVTNGVYQVELERKLCNKEMDNQLYEFFLNLSREKDTNEINFEPVFHFRMLKTAKWTDVMAYCPYYRNCKYLFSGELLEVLKEFKIQKHQLYDAFLYDKNNALSSHMYKMFHIGFMGLDAVDFSRCIFRDSRLRVAATIPEVFNNETEYQAYGKRLSLQRLALNSDFDNNLDLFQLQMEPDVFVSERLKRVLEKKNISGIEFRNDIEVVF